MTVAFNNIPGNTLVPFFYAEINSGGSPYEGQSRLLLLGQKLAGGTATADAPVGPIGSEAEAIGLFGLGSMLVDMYRIARRNAPFQPIWALPVADTGTAATATLTITAPGVSGVGVISVLGNRIPVSINAADTATQVAAAVVAAVNAAGIGVTASNASGVVTFTNRHQGLLGNGLELRVKTDEPNVFTTTNAVATAFASGTGTPTLTTALAGLGDQEYDWIASPFSDTTSLNAIRDFLSDSGTGRWGPMKQLYGHYITAVTGANLAAIVALGNARNDRHVTMLGTLAAPDPVWMWAAALGGLAALHLTDAPEVSRPLQTLEMVGIKPPVLRSNWWSIVDRQALYVDGIAAARVTNDGLVLIDRAVTTEQVNLSGVPDTTFRDMETLGQLMFIARFFRTELSNRHARQALADDNPGGIAEITTPADIKNSCRHIYRSLVDLGVTEKPDLFNEFLVAERDLNNATRVNLYLPVDVVNQLRVLAANITTFLQYR